MRHSLGELPESAKPPCAEVRRYAVVALTNLTFGNASIKSYLCGYPSFVTIMVDQLRPAGVLRQMSSDNLRKATAHLFRNLAWKADKSSKQVLAESDVVSVLVRAAMDVASRMTSPDAKDVEPALKVILSALWNLSAHCRKNKVKFVSVVVVGLPFHLKSLHCFVLNMKVSVFRCENPKFSKTTCEQKPPK